MKSLTRPEGAAPLFSALKCTLHLAPISALLDDTSELAATS